MIIELKYVSSNNAVFHTENSKIELDLKRNPTDLQGSIVELKTLLRKEDLATLLLNCFMWISLKRAARRERLLFLERKKK